MSTRGIPGGHARSFSHRGLVKVYQVRNWPSGKGADNQTRGFEEESKSYGRVACGGDARGNLYFCVLILKVSRLGSDLMCKDGSRRIESMCVMYV